MKRLPFTMLVVAALLFAGVLPRGWRAAFAQETFPPSPSMRAFPDQDAVDGWFWPLGAEVHLAIYRPADAGTPVFEMNGTVEVAWWDENETNLWFGLQGQYDLQRGDRVTLSGAGYETWLIVPDLWVTTIDADNDLVAGTAAPGMQVHIFVGGGEVYVYADGDGNWSATFADIGFDLQPGMCGAAEAWSEAIGHSSIFDWCAPEAPPPPPTPWLTAFPDWEYVEAVDWAVGVPVHLAIDDPSTAEAPDYQADTTTLVPEWEGNPERGWALFWLEGYDLKAGDVVRMTGGEFTLEHVVRNLAITGVDMDADTVAGTADPGVQLQAWVHGQPPLDVAADGEGHWLANFTGLHDIGYDMGGRAWIIGEGGNATAVQWSTPPPPPTPWLIAFPENEAVEGWEWPDGVTVYLSIDDPATGASPDYTNAGVAAVTSWGDPRTYFRLDFAGAYDLKVGDQVTLSDGATTAVHVVRYLAITGVDFQADTVSGTANPATPLQVWAHGQSAPPVDVLADGDGHWQASLSGVYDIVPGTGGRSWIVAEGGNATAVDWNVPTPWFTAFRDAVEGWDWPLDATVHLTVDDPATDESPDFEMDQVSGLAPWGSGQLWVWFDLAPRVLKAGDVIVLNDGLTTRTHVVRSLSITGADAGENIVTGTAEPGQEVILWSWEDMEGRRLAVTADGSGAWGADFDDIAFDLLPGYRVRAEVWDEAGNDTAVDWVVFAPAPPPNPITQGVHVRVPADAGWVASGVIYQEGWPIRITAEGQALTALPKDYPNAISGPDGQPTGCWTFDGVSPCALDGAPYGALIGKIGPDGEPFYIGAGMVLYWWGSGELYLAVNDNLPWYGDNKGAYMVLISR